MADDLSFDRADYGEQRAPACAQCGAPRGDGYFLLGQRTFCASCRAAIGDAWDRPIGPVGYARAIGAGIGAGALGAVAWALVEVEAHLQLGILAIGVGWAVAAAMRWGAGRGSRALQVVSVVVTYVAIVEASMIAQLAGGADNGPLAWLMGSIFALAMPYFVLQDGVSGVLWFVILGIALNAAWRRLAHPKLPWVGPLS